MLVTETVILFYFMNTNMIIVFDGTMVTRYSNSGERMGKYITKLGNQLNYCCEL